MKFQFFIDGREAAPLRDSWREAAQDAVSSGHAVWRWGSWSISMDGQGEVRRMSDKG